MTIQQNRTDSVFPNLMPPEVAKIGKRNLETLAAVQQEFLAAVNRANGTWVAYLNEEAALNSDFSKKVTSTRSIPDAAAAYQEWITQQINLLSKHAQKVLEETQDLTKSYTQAIGNGGAGGSS